MPDSPIIRLLKEHQRKWLKPAGEQLCLNVIPVAAESQSNKVQNNKNNQKQQEPKAREAREEHELVGVR